jgi:excisionase family DNA binding protein
MSPERRPPSVDDEFLTVAEVAATLKLNQQTIRNWIDAGSLPALRVGRRVRVLRRDLDQLLAEAEASATSASQPAPTLARTARGGATPRRSGAARRPPLHNAR